ncbi:uncharacterized protein LOC113774336 [Coffea eugenioides]|uniref:uncharacterized protein LOC113774336 n=1 Tax=Coffea eugenioides TaxID=49369 RepID=UPI000F604F71|nr:uncharacterized protein LOC113774336 [Coffea eugenioides]
MTHNGVQVSTFREAALLRGLLEDDDSQEIYLQEASLFHMAYEMRRLFAMLLVYSYIENQTREVLVEKSIKVLEEDLNAISLLNQNQRHAFEVIFKRIYENKSGVFFVDGPGGTRKSFLYRALLVDIRSKSYIALAIATSGIAASTLPRGRTVHSQFKIPIDTSEDRAYKISKQSSLAGKIFGGKMIVLEGDFRQTFPVVRKGSQSETVVASLINSPIWPTLENLELTQNMRARFDHSFIDFLLRVGDGTELAEDNSLIQLPSSI